MENERPKTDNALVVYQIPLGTQPIEISNYFRSIFPHLTELKMHISIPKKGKLVQNEIVKTAMAFLYVGSNEERDEIMEWYEQQKMYQVKFTNSHNITTSIHISYNYSTKEGDNYASSYKKQNQFQKNYNNYPKNSATYNMNYNTSFNSQYPQSRNKMSSYNFSEANRNTATQYYPLQAQMYQPQTIVSPSSDTQLYTPPLPLYTPPLPPSTPPTSYQGDDSSVHSTTSSLQRFNDLTEILKRNGFNHENSLLIQSISNEKFIWSQEKLAVLNELTRMEDILKRKSDLFVSELEVIELKSQEENYEKELEKYEKLLVEAKLELIEVKSDFEKLNQ